MAVSLAPTLTLPASLSEAEARVIHALWDWLMYTMPGQVERLILFGSKARGDTDAESDVDLLLELRDCSPARREAITEFVVEAELESHVDVTLLVYSRESLEEQVTLGTALMRNVAADGIALWGDPIMAKEGNPAEVARQLMESAREHVRIVKNNAGDRGYRAAISEAYYAFLDAADAALATKKIAPKSHAGAIDLFGLHFIKNGPVDGKYSRWFQRARKWRLEGTYERKLDWTEDEVRTAIESAEEFVNLIDSLIPAFLGETGDSPQPDPA